MSAQQAPPTAPAPPTATEPRPEPDPWIDPPPFPDPDPGGEAPQPLRVLLVAEACNPEWASVPLVGYNIASALARRPDLRIVLATHVRNADALRNDPLASDAEIHFFDSDPLHRPLHRLGLLLRGGPGLGWTLNTALALPAYLFFERLVLERLGERIRRGEFHLVHRVTPVSPTIHSPIAAKTRVPFVLGPLNGGLPWPTRYFPVLRSLEREWLAPLRAAHRFVPGRNAAIRAAAAIVAGSRHTASEIPRNFPGLRFHIPENGIDPERFPIRDHEKPLPPPGATFTLVHVGRLVPYKGAALAILALAELPETAPPVRLLVVGDGPERQTLEALARKLPEGRRVEFLGWLPQTELAETLADADAFLFPSLREFGGAVVLEAMAAGIPPIVVDYGGPGELVDPDVGIAVPLAERETLVRSLRDAVLELARYPERARKLGAAAARRVRERHLWSVKAAKIRTVYERTLARAKTPSNSTASHGIHAE